MQKAESEPISEDEVLWRRVRREKFRSDQTPALSYKAFEPRIKGREPDVDGISLFRASCLSSPTVIRGNPNENGIVQIPVVAIRRMGLTVVSSPTEAVPGHVVIQEINAAGWVSSKDRLRMIVEELALIASEPGNIVLRPEGV